MPRFYASPARRARLAALRRPWSQAASDPAAPEPEPEPVTSAGVPDLSDPHLDRKVVIRYYNEDGPGRYRRLRDNDEYSEAVAGVGGAKGDVSLQELERQMESLKELLEVVDTMDKRLATNRLLSLKKSLRDKLKATFRFAGGDALELGRATTATPQVPVDKQRSAQHRRALDMLNLFFRHLFDKHKGVLRPDDLVVGWKRYSDARTALLKQAGMVPPAVWNALFVILSWDIPENSNRMDRVLQLARDMAQAGVTLGPSQHLLALEALYVHGSREDALQGWKRAAATLGAAPEVMVDFWEMGVRMSCHSGDVERARHAVQKLLSGHRQFDARVLVPYIRCLATARNSNGTESSDQEARDDEIWEAIQLLKSSLGDGLTIEDYDDVIAALLAADCLDLALHTFVDMMFSGKVDSRGKAHLPGKIANRFFIGKWLKRLIGAGDLDGAFKVIRFLLAQKVELAPIQVNGLVGAWLRTGTAKNAKKAEQLAWSMIRSRMVFVDLRKREESTAWLPAARLIMSRRHDYVEDGGWLQFAPRATMETFSLLLRNYQKRRLYDQVNRLWEALGRCEMPMDDYFLNLSIKSCTDRGDIEGAVKLYRDMPAYGIPPNGGTFGLLFDTLSVHRLHVVDADAKAADRRAARRFFAELVAAPFAVEPAGGRALDLVHKVLYTFQKLADPAAMLVAAQAARALLGFRPTEPLLLALMTGSAPRDVTTTASPRRKRDVVRAARELELIVGARADALRAQGADLGNLGDEGKAEVLHLVLVDYVRARAARKGVELGEDVIKQAAREMGVWDVVIEPDEHKIRALTKTAAAKRPAA